MSSSDPHTPSASPASKAAPRAVVSRDARPAPPARPSRSAWSRSSRSITDAPPSTRSSVSGAAETACMASTTSRVWKAMASTDGPGQLRPPDAPGHTDDRAPGVGVPPRAAESGEGGHQVGAARVGDRVGQGTDLGRRGDKAELVAQPLHRGPGDEDGALRGRRPPWPGRCERPGHGREQAGHRLGAGGAHVHEHEAAGPVGVLGHARPEAGLAEEGGLLVAGDPADRHPGRPVPAPPRRRSSPAGHWTRRPRAAIDRGTPNRSASSSSHGSRPMSKSRVREALVGSVAWTAPPVSCQQHPAVDRPERQVGTGFHAALVQQPAQLGGREVGVEDEAGAGADQPQVAGRFERLDTGVRRAGPARRWRGGGAGPSAGPTARPSRAGW